jgi:nanoRNase/pAp phosphatase (c-di-AMP/oligoRNAs hydrolase)
MDHENCIVFQICYQQPDGKYKISIRVSEACDLDANKIAKSFDEGGGGHKKASGCDMTTEQINNLK